MNVNLENTRKMHETDSELLKKPVLCRVGQGIKFLPNLLARKFPTGGRAIGIPRDALLPHYLLITLLVITQLSLLSEGGNLKKFSTVDLLQDQPIISAAFIAQQNEACDMTKLCTHEEMEVSPICGTDGRTYNSLCEIKRAACHGNPVEKKFDGPCPEKSKCKLERTFQQDMAIRKNQSTIFVPECEEDGSYSTVQCHQTTGYCWCVTKLGRPIPGSSVQFKRPNCFPQGKVGRRSSRRRLGRRRKGCTTADRSTFSNNLMEMFRSEFERDPMNKYRYKQTSNSYGLLTSLDEKILIWKFNQLDGNKNGKLSRREIRGLKRMVRKVVQPRACARRFTKYCDLNHDRQTSRKEWFICLGVNINTSFRVFNSLTDTKAETKPLPVLAMPIQNDPPANPPVAPPGDMDVLSASALPGNVETASHLWPSTGKSGTSDFLLKESESTTVSPKEEATDCQSQKQKAIQELRTNPNGGIYVPDCTGRNGKLYANVQCHKMTQFCWCADEETGKPIPGTSSRYTRPDCDQVQINLGEIKGCTERKREKFFNRFYSTLESSMIASGNTAFSEDMSSKELAVRWKFAQLDTNKNNRLERREWKVYRAEMKTWKGVRKCGRNFMRFCDQDENKKITLNEWINCALKAETRPAILRGKIGPPRGKNPFLGILDPNQ